MRKKFARVFLITYKYISQINRQILMSTWGFVSECKHQPTCSEYMAEQIAKNGWQGIGKGLKRLWSCR